VRRSTLIICAGGLILLVGAALTLGPWLEAERWQSSPAAVQAERNAAAPTTVPLRAAPTLVVRPTAPPAATAASLRASNPRVLPTAAPTPAPTVVPDVSPPIEAAPPTPTLGPSRLRLGEVAFQFLDPPQPGATALLSLAIHNPTDQPGGAVSLDLPQAWLKGYSIEGVVPLPVDGTLNGERVDQNLRFTVDGPSPGEDAQVAVYVVTTDEVIDAPALRVVDAEGREIGRAQPPTEAPRAPPGPVYSIDIPSLHLHTGVVQVDWEPPLFVVGQLRSSAHVTEGNSVLIGHVRGAAGYNVFDRLDRVGMGERIVANSRGSTYEFVVTQREVLPKDDTSPTLATRTPRLTLMTCAGEFNPLTGEYPDRLWIVAEPVDVVDARANLPAAAPVQPSAVGGLGNTDADLARAYGAPVGESPRKLTVYRRNGVERQAQYVDGAGKERRADVVVERSRADASFTLDEARRHATALLPRDAVARSASPEGNGRFVVEYFTSESLEQTLPAESFTEREGEPGDVVAVYRRRPDGRITDILVGIGSDPSELLALLD
jgi:sortase (surface protein transpeptidase)